MKRVLPLAASAAWLVISVPAVGAADPAPAAEGGALANQDGSSAEGLAEVQSSASPRARSNESFEAVRFSTRDNLSLAADFYAPRRRAGAGRSPAVLLVHEAGGNRSQLSAVADRLHRVGFAVLSLDLRGHGESASERFDWNVLDADERAHMWALSVRDLAAAAEFLRGRSDVHTANLSLIGLRTGAAVAVHYAADDQNARAVVMLDPQPDSLGFNLLQDVGRLGGLPTLILAPTHSRGVAERLAQSGHDANGGEAYIKHSFIRGDSKDLMEDKRVPRDVGDWLRSQVMLGKGDR